MGSINTKFILILIIVVVVIALLGNLELFINKRNCVVSVPISKDSNTLLPEYTGFKDPIYVYNSKKVKRKDLDYKLGYTEDKYIKKPIQEHIASKITHPLKELGAILKKVPKSKMPLNTLYSSFGKGGELINTADPLSYNSLSGYKMLTSTRDNAEAFIAGNKLYITRPNNEK